MQCDRSKVLMQEIRSFRSYLGALGPGRRARLGAPLPLEGAKRPVALGAATALVIWTPAKEEVAAIMVGVCAGMMSDGGNTLAKGRSVS